MAVAVLIGAFGVTGASLASAHAVVDLDPKKDPSGAHCMVIDDVGDETYLHSRFECSSATTRIALQERREDRRDERRDERR